MLHGQQDGAPGTVSRASMTVRVDGKRLGIALFMSFSVKLMTAYFPFVKVSMPMVKKLLERRWDVAVSPSTSIVMAGCFAGSVLWWALLKNVTTQFASGVSLFGKKLSPSPIPFLTTCILTTGYGAAGSKRRGMPAKQNPSPYEHV